MTKALLTTAILLGTLLSGAGVAAAAPPFAGPTDIASPTVHPEPEPCEAKKICDFTLPTEAELPTDVANPTIEPDPTIPTGPTDVANPTVTPEPTEPPVTTTTEQPPVQQPQDPPSGVPTPNRIDTGEGPVDESANLWLLVIPMVALLGLAAAGTMLVIRRSERRPS